MLGESHPGIVLGLALGDTFGGLFCRLGLMVEHMLKGGGIVQLPQIASQTAIA